MVILLVVFLDLSYFSSQGENTNMPLTNTNIINVKASGKVQKLTDGEGLYLYISPTGGKLWRRVCYLPSFN